MYIYVCLLCIYVHVYVSWVDFVRKRTLPAVLTISRHMKERKKRSMRSEEVD